MKVSWVFDVISPFAYLAIKQFPRLPATVEVEFVPVLFAGLLDHHGQIGNAEIPSKRRFTYRFALWRARKLGIEMRPPPNHPFNPLMALRLIIAAGCTRRSIETLFDAVWLQGRDVADPNVIAEIATQLGVSDVASAIAQPSVKQKLRENTEWALSRKVFGVPTFVIGDELFWGQDGLEMALDYLRDPVAFEDEGMRAIERVGVGAVRPASR
jgi:2-hydroxychromene-2-carboxylate isomerase